MDTGQDTVSLRRNIWSKVDVLYCLLWCLGCLERRGRTAQDRKNGGAASLIPVLRCGAVSGGGEGGGGGGGESFTRLTLCLVCRVTPGRTDQDTPQHFPRPDGHHQGPQSLLTC